MNDVQHINVKIFAAAGAEAPWHEMIPIFHRWIQQRAMPEALIDVADYAHVPAGPGIMLIGHEAFYSLDNRARRLGFLYNRRTVIDGSAEEKLRQAWESARTGALRLAADLDGRLQFDENDVEVFVNDRLLAPNTEETLEAFVPAIRAVFGEEALIEKDPDPRGLFRVSVKRS